MPGVDLGLMATSEDHVTPLTSLDGECAESGLESVIGDFLADSLVADSPDKEERSSDDEVGRLELTLQCAVQEIHCDLKAFGEHVDARLKDTTAHVAPVIEAIATLQEENVRLRLQQETLARQVEALCQALGLPASRLHQDQDPELPNKVQSKSPEPIPHPPTFALRRSSSTSSQTGCFSRSNSMVCLCFRIVRFPFLLICASGSGLSASSGLLKRFRRAFTPTLLGCCLIFIYLFFMESE